jgi:hypothetical protein
MEKMRESDKPDFVICLATKSNHSSRVCVATVLKRFTLGPPGAGVFALNFLASDRVYSALHLYRSGRLIKPAFSAFSFKTSLKERDVFCYTFRSLTAPSLSLVSAPMKSRLSSPKKFCILSSDCLPSLKKLCTCEATTTTFSSCCIFGSCFSFLPVVNA